MLNPIKEIRLELGKTIIDMALKLGVNYTTYLRAEEGANLTVSPIILDRMNNMGYDKDAIEEKYKKWRQSKKSSK